MEETGRDQALRVGTAGFRAPRGDGPGRMNREAVQRIAAGVASWLPDGASVVVGRDGRARADEFASAMVEVLVAAGCMVQVLQQPAPTPLLAHVVRERGLAGGLMCTASHNPPADSGVKVYVAPGCQLDPADEAAVEAAVAAVDVTAAVPPHRTPTAVDVVDGEAVERYLAEVVEPLAATGPSDVALVYTPLHGVGAGLLLASFDSAGLPAPVVVPQQAEPDPLFPTTPYPNPEEPGTLDLAIELAERTDADAVLANDPDADRLAVVVPWPDEGWRVLTGDEVGALLAEHLLASGTGADRLVVATAVSSRLVGRIAAAHGARYVETPTGFKWVMRAVLDHPELRFVLGYEEALGYAVSDRVLDKDGISAAVVFARLLAQLRAEGRTVLGALAELAGQHGLHATRTLHLRSAPDTVVPSLDEQGEVWSGRDDVRVVARRSGTEPKVKVYLEVVTPLDRAERGRDAAYLAACDASRVRLDALEAEARAWLGRA